MQVLSSHRSLNLPDNPPLFVGVQGPQGSGKTYLTTHLGTALSSPPYNVKAVIVSIDDLYLPRDGLLDVAKSHPGNSLLVGRGQPGTHDIPLGTEILQNLKGINRPDSNSVGIPKFDKSLFDGFGDRVAGSTVIGPVDLVIFEGWCVGFCPIEEEEVARRYELPVKGIEDSFDLRAYKKADIMEVNSLLSQYLEWWTFFDAFIQIKPPDSHPYAFIYKWRLHQEHDMKARNGGKGMTDEQVKKFIDRYIPGYVFFSDGIESGHIDGGCVRNLPRWRKKGLRIVIGENRELRSVEAF
ncbi:P-loop containing nucleoside triphosphate hydrolase protein [Rickenella mellea]|uniref:P-loop containing nucleoside triphosphate hydrolase protein n=1 Tax=Rickenella mellea TaxID=50990 RepID=A0A4Y7Q858_9AGAM|nr:P-loop containing nucleoside triphosphate hydrolase protein [Rickenella mellea]